MKNIKIFKKLSGKKEITMGFIAFLAFLVIFYTLRYLLGMLLNYLG